MRNVSKLVKWWTISAIFPIATQAQCPSDELRSVTRPVAEGSSQTFEYKYRFKCENPNWPTVIFVPGGPGMTSTDDSQKDFPKNANIIFTDPRGTGVNKEYWTKKPEGKRVTTEDVADDVVSIVKKLGLKNYVLYGHSFGTAVATVAGSKIDNDLTLATPKVILLEGTVGRAAQVNDQSDAAKAFWNKVKSEAYYCVECKADQKLEKFSKKDVGNVISMALEAGLNGAYVHVFLNRVDDEQFGETAKKLEQIVSADQLRLYKNIGCHEFFELGITDTEYDKGELKLINLGTCEGEKLDQPYDSRKWPIKKTKLIYIAGTHDTATPLMQMVYHYEGQSQTNKQLICAARGGHSPLTQDLKDCNEKIWSTILAGNSNLSKALEECSNAAAVSLQQCLGISQN